MTKEQKTEEDHIVAARSRLLEAALDHVMFDGWSADVFATATKDSGVNAGLATQACPRGAIDLALAFHTAGDQAMIAAMQENDMSEMRYRDRIAFGIRARLDAVADSQEAVRRGAALFALPQHTGDGVALIWGTADAIWNTLGDTSRDVNWYSKRATLSAVYSATVLFWLGDESEGHVETWAFLDRRIDDVMQIEKLKAKLRENPLVKSFMTGPGRAFGKIKAPNAMRRSDLPGYVSDRT